METALVIVSFLFLLAGLLGSILPALPGPPLSYAGLLLLQWSGRGNFSPAFLVIWAVITAVVTVADNVFPALLTKRFGGSRLAVIGSVLGLLAGTIFFAPAGLIIGPFLGAFAGELIHNRASGSKALKAALGAFLAFLLGTGAKLVAGSFMIFYAVKAIF